MIGNNGRRPRYENMPKRILAINTTPLAAKRTLILVVKRHRPPYTNEIGNENR